jgi:acetoin utilization protein AcuB
VTVKDFVSEIYPVIQSNGTVGEARARLEEFGVRQIPVLEGLRLAGMINKADLTAEVASDQPLDNYISERKQNFIYEDRHIFDAIRLFSSTELSLLPVVNTEENFTGVILPEDMLQEFGNSISFQNPGAVITLEVSQKDYSAAEISQIVESNDAAILGLLITSTPDEALLEVSVKVNRADLSSILQTFSRYNYVVKETYGEGAYLDNLKDRYNQLMTYLNM